MKKKKDLSAIIKTINPKSASDKDKIMELCTEIDKNISFPKGANNGHIVIFKDFKYWIKNKFPKIGDTIFYEQSQTLGIIDSINENDIHLGVAILGQDGLVTSGVDRPKIGFRYATEDEILTIHKHLARKGFTWNIWRNSFAKCIFYPRQNMFVRFKSYVNDDHGIGVFNTINSDGELIMFCAINGTEAKARYSLSEIIGPAERYQVGMAHRNDIAKLKSALADAGKTWNGIYNRIEPLNFHIDNGQDYYYINDRNEIVSAKKNESKAYKQRLSCGNYYIDRSQAEDMKAKIYEYRKRQLSFPD